MEPSPGEHYPGLQEPQSPGRSQPAGEGGPDIVGQGQALSTLRVAAFYGSTVAV